MRIIFLGTGGFGVPTFRSLVESHHVAGVLCRPSTRGPRHHAAAEHPMLEAARSLGIDAWQPPDVNDPDGLRLVTETRAQLLVVCDFGQILSAQLLAATPLGGINLHGSLLPKYRGAAPVQWAIYQGERQTGVSVIHMTPRLDAGPVLVQQATDIGPDETAEQLEERLARLGVEAVGRAIRQLAQWDGRQPLGRPQQAAQASRAPRLKKEHGRVDWHRSAEQIRNQIRAFKPWPGTFTELPLARGGTMRVILDRVRVAGASPGVPPGSVVTAERQLQVAAGDGLLEIQRLQPAGKRVMTADEFLRGYPLAVGPPRGAE